MPQNQRVQFAKGLKSNYFSGANSTWNQESFTGTVYFASDSNEIYVDGTAYGIGGAVLQVLKSNDFVSAVEIRDDSNHNQQFYIKYFDKTGAQQELSIDLLKVTGINAISVGHKKKTVQAEGSEEATEEITHDYEISLKIADTEDILSQDSSGLKSTLSLDYTNNTIQLKGKNGKVIDSISIADLTKDSFVESGSVVVISDEAGSVDTSEASGLAVGTTALKLVLKIVDNSASEGASDTMAVYISAASLIDTYTAGNGISFGTVGENNSGAGVPIQVKVKDGGHLTVDAEGLAVDLTSFSGSDIKVSSDSEDTIPTAVAAAKTAADNAQSAADTAAGNISTLSDNFDDYKEEVQGIIDGISFTGSDINLGTDIASGLGKSQTLDEAISTLNDKIAALSGEDGDIQSIGALNTTVNNLVKTVGTGSNGTFAISDYASTLAFLAEFEDADAEGGKRKAKNIAEIISVEDASLRALISANKDSYDSDKSVIDASISALDASISAIDYRVNDVKGILKTVGEETYTNISINDSNINLSEDSVSGALGQSQTISDAMALIDDSLTWQLFETTSSPSSED